MTADDLQRWASLLRWIGLSVTGLGVAITFGSHYIADKLIVAQRASKAAAEQQTAEFKSELGATKEKNAQLEKRLQPRSITDVQARCFIEAATGIEKSLVQVWLAVNDTEARQFAESFNALMSDSGFGGSKFLNSRPGGIPAGMRVDFLGGERRPPGAEGFLAALKVAGFEFTVGGDAPILGESTIQVTIGGKPNE